MIGGDEKKKLPKKADVLLKLDRMKAMRDGEVPPGRYSLNDALDMIEARRAEVNPEEEEFQKWYAGYASKLGLDADPDNPLHYYDYRKAHQAGATPNEAGHWPSQFKLPGHPNRYVDGMDTMTGKPIEKQPSDSTRFQKFKAAAKSAIDPKRKPEGDGFLQSKFKKAAKKSA